MQSGTQGSLGGSSLPLREAQVSFDVAKESEVIALLKYIHQNPIDPDTKNALRDAIFTYRQELSPATFATLKAVCAGIGVALVSEQAHTVVPATPTTSTRFNTGRPLPSFKTVKEQSVVQTQSVPPERKITEDAAVSSVPLRKIVVPKFEVTQPQPVVPPEPIVTPVPEKVEEKVVEPKSSTIDIGAAQARISEIKHAVNAKVGNPVNLIDAHNEVGRSYMNALLDAMKKANGGAEGELARAMETLEGAYAAVLTVLEGVPLANQEKVVTEQVAQTPVEVPYTPAPLVASAEVKPPVLSEQERVQQMKERLNALKAKVVEARQNQASVAQAASIAPVASAPTYVASAPLPPQTEVTQSAPTRQTAQDAGGLHSVAKNKQLQDLLRSNREKEIATEETKTKEAIAKMDPIDTPEVTAGLSQLLSEWSLFRSSGFFGTGPSGKDHVLYQKLAPLTMASVIAGRFEGATPLIKQSIADYMNGWRYEEGIVHEHGETFEHYLRKVVYHIIEKKKKALIK